MSSQNLESSLYGGLTILLSRQCNTKLVPNSVHDLNNTDLLLKIRPDYYIKLKKMPIHMQIKTGTLISFDDVAFLTMSKIEFVKILLKDFQS